MSVSITQSTQPLGGAITLNGSSQYLTTTGPITLGTALFTIELWVNFAALPGAGSFASLTCQGTNFRLFLEGSSNAISVWENATPRWVTAATGIVINTWYHICVMRSSSTQLDIYVNGVLQSKTTNTTTLVTYTGTGMTVGYDNSSSTYYANATITNQRYVNGAAAYPIGGFQKPWGPATNVTGTQLLLLAQTAGTFTNDSSTANTGGTPYTVTATGTPTYSATTPFSANTGWTMGPGMLVGGPTVPGSLLLNGSTQYVTYAVNSNILPALNQPFTMEFWAYPLSTQVRTNPGICSSANNGGLSGHMSFFFGHSGLGAPNQYGLYWNGMTAGTGGTGTTTNFLTSPGKIVTNTWTHVAVVRVGTSAITMYINGTAVATTSYNGAMVSPTNTWWIGVSGDSIGSANFAGYISNYRLITGTAVYTSNFTPSIVGPLPATQAANVYGSPSVAIASGTQLLLQTPNSASFLSDSSTNGYVATNNGSIVANGNGPFYGWGPPPAVQYLMVAGGGGGGTFGGGGGGGGFINSSGNSTSYTVQPGNVIQITVGGGGTAGTTSVSATIGGNSIIFNSATNVTVTAVGGGYGGGRDVAGGNTGGAGGSGGGGSTTAANNAAGGTAITGQGSVGGIGGADGGTVVDYPSGGGGGSDAAGQRGTTGLQAGYGGTGNLNTFVTTFAGTGNIVSGSTTLTLTTTTAGNIRIGTQITGANIRAAQSFAISSITTATNVVTVNFATQTFVPFAVGMAITIANVTTTTNFNGTFTCTGATTSTATFASTLTGTAGVATATISSLATYIVSGTGPTYVMSAPANATATGVSLTSLGTYYSGGGGGSVYSTLNPGQGGAGGGGLGGNTQGTLGTAGGTNTGGGGGGGGFTSAGGAGGSGVVIIRYPIMYTAAVTTTGSPTVTTDSTYRYYRFTGTGNITF